MNKKQDYIEGKSMKKNKMRDLECVEKEQSVDIT